MLLKISQNSQKNLCQNLFFNKVAKRLWQRCFPVNFAKFLRKTIFIEHLRWPLPCSFHTQHVELIVLTKCSCCIQIFQNPCKKSNEVILKEEVKISDMYQKGRTIFVMFDEVIGTLNEKYYDKESFRYFSKTLG